MAHPYALLMPLVERLLVCEMFAEALMVTLSPRLTAEDDMVEVLLTPTDLRFAFCDMAGLTPLLSATRAKTLKLYVPDSDMVKSTDALLLYSLIAAYELLDGDL